MKNALCSLIIPISGNIPNLDSIKETLRNASDFDSEISIILLFDKKESELSARNWSEISSWDFANLKLHSEVFSSVGTARNYGLSMSDSKWVAFTDADDVNNVRNFISMIHEAENLGSDIAIGKFNSNQNFLKTTDSSQSEVWNSETFQIPFGLNPGIWRCGFRSSSINEIRFPNLNMAEDQIFIARFFQVARKIYFSHLNVYTYSAGVENSLTNRPDQVRKITAAIEISLELVHENKGPYLFLIETLTASQILSGIKYGKFKTQIFLLGRFLIFLTSGGLAAMIRRTHILMKALQR
jgi:glycosyltransferase involved in cell wall biosynthesis